MEEAASANGEVLLGKMRALARRGALLRRATDGAGSIEQADQLRGPQCIAPQEFLRMLDAGWLRANGADRYVMSKRGVTALRNMLARPVPSTARAAPGSLLRPRLPQRPAVARTEPPQLNARESPLAWLRQRRDKDGKEMISATEFDAGERLRCDFERGQLGQRVTASWNPAAVSSGKARGAPGGGLEMAESTVAARQRVDAALKAVGPELTGVLLDVCCFLKGLEQAERNGGWPRRAGKVVLQLALAHLARHYGMHRAGGANDGAGRVRSWGAPGFRPDIDAPDGSAAEEENAD